MVVGAAAHNSITRNITILKTRLKKFHVFTIKRYKIAKKAENPLARIFYGGRLRRQSSDLCRMCKMTGTVRVLSTGIMCADMGKGGKGFLW